MGSKMGSNQMAERTKTATDKCVSFKQSPVRRNQMIVALDTIAEHGVLKIFHRMAERAAQNHVPERDAQHALGHNSKAVHRAYAKRAQVTGLLGGL